MNGSAKQQPTPSLSSSTEVFDRVADELRDVAKATYRIQDALGEIVENAASVKGDVVLDLQELDQVSQTIENLAQFMASLASPNEVQLDAQTAARYLKLSDLAKRLAEGATPDGKQANTDEINGDLDLF
ncbi:MAG: hypothetical protein AAGA22_01645 [Pseudomonadota bacterium]